MESQPQLDAPGKTLEIKKQSVFNNCYTTEPHFLRCLKTLMYSYVLRSMKDELDAQMLIVTPLAGVAFELFHLARASSIMMFLRS